MSTQVTGSTSASEEINEALERLFSLDSELHRGRGFLERRIAKFGDVEPIDKVLEYLEAQRATAA